MTGFVDELGGLDVVPSECGVSVEVLSGCNCTRVKFEKYLQDEISGN